MTTFADLAAFRAEIRNFPKPDADARRDAEDRNGVLTKPPAALGRLEELAIWYAGWRGNPTPVVERP